MGQTTSRYTTPLRPLHTRCRLQKLWGKLNNCRKILRENLPGLIAAYRKVTALLGHRINGITTNITHARGRKSQKSNFIVPT